MHVAWINHSSSEISEAHQLLAFLLVLRIAVLLPLTACSYSSSMAVSPRPMVTVER